MNVMEELLSSSFLRKEFFCSLLTLYFENPGMTNIGYDEYASCNRYTSYGVEDRNNWKEEDEVQYTYYVCWHERPDGIYVNDIMVNVGTLETCFNQSYPWLTDNRIMFFKYLDNKETRFGVNFESDDFYFRYTYGRLPIVPDSIDDNIPSEGNNSAAINKIEFIKDGKAVVTLTGSDLEDIESDYYIVNDTKLEKVLNYFNPIYEYCLDD